MNPSVSRLGARYSPARRAASHSGAVVMWKMRRVTSAEPTQTPGPDLGSTVTADGRVRTAPSARREPSLQQGRGHAEHGRALGARRAGVERCTARGGADGHRRRRIRALRDPRRADRRRRRRALEPVVGIRVVPDRRHRRNEPRAGRPHSRRAPRRRPAHDSALQGQDQRAVHEAVVQRDARGVGSCR